jgi:glutaredoxin
MGDFGFLQGHSLVVYSSSGCPDCARLEHWMRHSGVQAQTVLIDEEPDAADKLERETGMQAVPFILVDGKSWVRGYHREQRSGLDEATLLAELRAAISS